MRPWLLFPQLLCLFPDCPDFLFACTRDYVSFYHKLCGPRGSSDGGLQSGKPSAPKKLKLDVGEALAPSSHRKGDRNANSDVCAAALRGGSTGKEGPSPVGKGEHAGADSRAALRLGVW